MWAFSRKSVENVFGDAFKGYVFSPFVEGVKHRHKHRARLGSGMGACAKTNLPRNHCRTQVPFCPVVVFVNPPVQHPVEEAFLMGYEDVLGALTLR
jgi:hypothetical protein